MFLRIFFSVSSILGLLYLLSETSLPELIAVLIGTIVCALLILWVAYKKFKFIQDEVESWK